MVGEFSIYALADPDTDEIRYVGITRVPLCNRLTRHICDARLKRERNPKVQWLNSLSRKGRKPTIVLLESTNDYTRERYWIQHHREIGTRLTNSSDGCESRKGYMLPASTRQAVSRANRKRVSR